MYYIPPQGAFTDTVIRALSQIGVKAHLRPSGLPEVTAGPAVGGASAGILGIDTGRVRWINVQANLPFDWFMLLYGVPDKRINSGFKGVEVNSHLKRSGGWVAKRFRRNRRAVSFAESIARSFDRYTELNTLIGTSRAKFAIVADPAVESWVVSTAAGNTIAEVSPTQVLWDVLQRIASHLLEHPVPMELRNIRLSPKASDRRRSHLHSP